MNTAQTYLQNKSTDGLPSNSSLVGQILRAEIDNNYRALPIEALIEKLRFSHFGGVWSDGDMIEKVERVKRGKLYKSYIFCVWGTTFIRNV